jgi:hypothetical protein
LAGVVGAAKASWRDGGGPKALQFTQPRASPGGQGNRDDESVGPLRELIAETTANVLARDIQSDEELSSIIREIRGEAAGAR